MERRCRSGWRLERGTGRWLSCSCSDLGGRRRRRTRHRCDLRRLQSLRRKLHVLLAIEIRRQAPPIMSFPEAGRSERTAHAHEATNWRNLVPKCAPRGQIGGAKKNNFSQTQRRDPPTEVERCWVHAICACVCVCVCVYAGEREGRRDRSSSYTREPMPSPESSGGPTAFAGTQQTRPCVGQCAFWHPSPRSSTQGATAHTHTPAHTHTRGTARLGCSTIVSRKSRHTVCSGSGRLLPQTG